MIYINLNQYLLIKRVLYQLWYGKSQQNFFPILGLFERIHNLFN